MINIGDSIRCKKTFKYKDEISFLKDKRYIIQMSDSFQYDIDLVEFSLIGENGILDWITYSEYLEYFEDVNITKRNDKIDKILNDKI